MWTGTVPAINVEISSSITCSRNLFNSYYLQGQGNLSNKRTALDVFVRLFDVGPQIVSLGQAALEHTRVQQIRNFIQNLALFFLRNVFVSTSG